MKIKHSYILKKVMGKYMIVSLEESASQTLNMQTINDTGAFIWNLVADGATEEEICEKMITEYDIDKETAAKDISKFIDALEKAGILER